MLLLGVNIELTEQSMKDFCLIYNCRNIIRHKTCYKNSYIPKCIDLTMKNMPKPFQNLQQIEAGLSDFHKMCFIKRNRILSSIEAIKKFQMDLLSMISKMHLFSSRCYAEKLRKTFDITLKKLAVFETYMLEQTTHPSSIKLHH